MRVEDIMETDVVTCDYDDSLRAAAVRMLERGVGSVIVLRDGNPHGIVTEMDALAATTAADRPLSEIPISDALSHPLVTVNRDRTVRSAVARMKEHDVKKLPVVEDLELVGIVTRSDVVFHYDDFIREVRTLTHQQGRWET